MQIFLQFESKIKTIVLDMARAMNKQRLKQSWNQTICVWDPRKIDGHFASHQPCASSWEIYNNNNNLPTADHWHCWCKLIFIVLADMNNWTHEDEISQKLTCAVCFINPWNIVGCVNGLWSFLFSSASSYTECSKISVFPKTFHCFHSFWPSRIQSARPRSLCT